MSLRKRLGRRLWGWSIRLYDDFHEIEVFDANGERAATVGCYGQHVVTWKRPYDVEVISKQRE